MLSFDQRFVGRLQQPADSAHKAVCLISDVTCKVKDGYHGQWQQNNSNSVVLYTTH